VSRRDISSRRDIEAELRRVPSPRREASAIRRASLEIVALWFAGSGLWYIFYSRHAVTSPGDLPELMVVGLKALALAMLTPVLPVGHLVRRRFARRRQESVKIEIGQGGVRWTSRSVSSGKLGSVSGCLNVRLGSSPCVVVEADELGPPFSLCVSDESTAQRICAALQADESRPGKFVFPVWPAGVERSDQLFKRASLALFCAAFAAFYATIAAIEPWWLFYVLFLLGPFALVAGVYFLLASWGALVNERPSKLLSIDALQVSLDGVLLCLHTEQAKLRIIKRKSAELEDMLEIASSRIPEGKCRIHPWQRGDLHEIELIKATIETYRARASEEARG